MGSLIVSFIILLGLSLSPQATASSPVPPLQWLNITPLIKGPTKPPGLKNPAIGYDESTRSVIIFGGEASSGVGQGETYLLNLETLTWSIPNPPTTLTRTPPPRSSAVSGCDVAASNRNGFVVLGGKGSDGSALSDAWEYDFNNQFWSEINISPGGPSPRYGASGGIDIRIAAVPDPVLPGPNNTFLLWGGSDGQSLFSDLWRLNISGTLSSNLPDEVSGTWEHLPLPDLPSNLAQGSAVLSRQIISSGGCNDTTISGASCARQDTYVINASNATTASEVAAINCPAPRLSPTLVPNGNRISPSFASQMMLLLGTFNATFWDDGGGLKKGEVAILDVNTRSYTRVIPAGDPGSTDAVPSPRDGATAIFSPQTLVGTSRTTASDILVFGGRDISGNYLSEVWVLRAYNGVVTPEDTKNWSGYGDGRLQTGVNSKGTGVVNQFVSTCASPLAQPVLPTSPNSTSPPGPDGPPDGPPAASTSLISTSILHKLLGPLSVALLLPSFLLFRFTSPAFNTTPALPRVWLYVSAFLALAAYGLGIAGLSTSFTTRSSTITDAPRPSPLTTIHGRVGLALFICLYVVVPLLAMLHASSNRNQHVLNGKEESRKRSYSDATEKDPFHPSTHSPSPPNARSRTHSWGPSSWRKSRDDRLSSDSESMEVGEPVPAKRGFEVMNRPARTRQASGSRLGVPSSPASYHTAGSQSLGALDWLERSRSLATVGEQSHPIPQQPPPSTPGTLLDPTEKVSPSDMRMPASSTVSLRLFIHASLLALIIFCLASLWLKAPRSTFGVFLAWTLAFYITLLTSSWHGKPEKSILALGLRRLRTPHTEPRPSASDTLAETEETIHFPYLHHRPPYRATFLSEPTGPPGADTDDDDDDRAEDEMRRRDISIVTSYPKAKLRITNPSSNLHDTS